jgi:cytochrome c oxidase assembly protein Cox11
MGQRRLETGSLKKTKTIIMTFTSNSATNQTVSNDAWLKFRQNSLSALELFSESNPRFSVKPEYAEAWMDEVHCICKTRPDLRQRWEDMSDLRIRSHGYSVYVEEWEEWAKAN